MPSWLPTKPSSWIDFGESLAGTFIGILNKTVPHAEDSEENKLAEARGHIMGWVEELSAWLLYSFYPQKDENALFLDLWEKTFGITPESTIRSRSLSILGRIRLLGKPTSTALIKSVYSSAFDTKPEDVGITYPTQADIVSYAPQTSWQYAFAVYQYHVYRIYPGDYIHRIAKAWAQKISPAGWTISVGPNKEATYDADYGYGQSTYGV